MGGRVLAQLALVVADAGDLALAHDDRTDRHVVVIEGALGLAQREAHEVLVEGEEVLGHRPPEASGAPQPAVHRRYASAGFARRDPPADPLDATSTPAPPAPNARRSRLAAASRSPRRRRCARNAGRAGAPAGALARHSSPASSSSATARARPRPRGALARSGIASTTPSGDAITTVSLRRGVSVPAAVARLRRGRGVAWAVPDYIAHAAQLPPPLTPTTLAARPSRRLAGPSVELRRRSSASTHRRLGERRRRQARPAARA